MDIESAEGVGTTVRLNSHPSEFRLIRLPQQTSSRKLRSRIDHVRPRASATRRPLTSRSSSRPSPESLRSSFLMSCNSSRVSSPEAQIREAASYAYQAIQLALVRRRRSPVFTQSPTLDMLLPSVSTIVLVGSRPTATFRVAQEDARSWTREQFDALSRTFAHASSRRQAMARVGAARFLAGLASTFGGPLRGAPRRRRRNLPPRHRRHRTYRSDIRKRQ